jgi:hypothetical protein
VTDWLGHLHFQLPTTMTAQVQHDAASRPAGRRGHVSVLPSRWQQHQPTPSLAGSPSRFFLRIVTLPRSCIFSSTTPHGSWLTRIPHHTTAHLTASIRSRLVFRCLPPTPPRVVSCFPIPIEPVDPQRPMVFSDAASPLVATAADSASSCVAHLRCCCRVSCCCCC